MTAGRVTLPFEQKLAFQIDEAASAVGLSRSTLYEAIKAGELELGKICGRSVIKADVLREWCDRRVRKVSVVAERPSPPVCGVYMLRLDSQIVYVGRSTTLQARLSTHRRSGREFDEVEVIECEAETSAWLERELIRTLRPAQNLIRYTRHSAIAAAKLRGLAP